MSLPVVAIVGRPNVGKSTLFNRVVSEKAAVVAPEPGVTRDRHYRDTEWAGRRFTLVDTGGLSATADGGEIEALVTAQARRAIDEADLIIFLLDAQTGVTPGDESIADLIRRAHKPVLVVVNKVDNFTGVLPTADFYRLGLGEPLCISAEAGLNIGDLLDAVIDKLPEAEVTEEQEPVRVAVIGRPNVGKSSLVNAILGEERVIVSNEPGTTRDAVDTTLQLDDRVYTLIDTAGIRRKARIATSLEKYSVSRAHRALRRCDIAILVLDASVGVTAQDKRLAGIAAESRKGLIIVLNKCDIITGRTKRELARIIPVAFAFVAYAPVLPVSAVTGQGIGDILPTVDRVMEAYSRRIPTAALNKVIAEAVLATPPPAFKKRRGRVLYATQTATRPPTIVLFVNEPEAFTTSYLRYLENRLREAYELQGSPMRLILRKREA
ncbi:MAG TPA: ribosome biogenesis GTPase Der [Peptococcaceae bacterium]|nr:ribosome biogenesis GTPase Der [Peptococcaceae bacterium]